MPGRPFAVLPWQRRFVRHAFAPGVQSAALSVARGNGKTALLSGIAAATLDGPLAVRRGETVIVASSFEQARIAFEHVVAFMGDKLEDKGRWRVWDTAQQARVEDKQTGARVRCIGSDPRRAHGLAPVLVLADEPAQWPETTGERMVAALRTAAGKQPHSRFVALGTRPADETHWFAKMLAVVRGLRPMPRGSGRTIRRSRGRTWAKANPSHGAYAGFGGGHTPRSRGSATGPGHAGGLRGASFEPGDRGQPRFPFCWTLADVARCRGRGRPDRAPGVGGRSRDQRGAIGGRRVLAGDRSA